jgi:hypothetical protein
MIDWKFLFINILVLRLAISLIYADRALRNIGGMMIGSGKPKY